MVRKTASWRTSVDTRDVRQQHKASGKDVVVPLVLWNEPPRVEVAALHVLLLPVSQPSQNSSSVALDEDRDVNNEDDNEEDTRTQLCVFAGTVDGVVLYWRFEQDTVEQVNMLVFPGSEGSGQPVVGIVSGTDEWGQSTLISATKDGALARWQLPNGACAEANASLAKELAPLLGLEMLCNKRFAVVVSEESRLMVLDTWRMQLLYCMDTAQEQIRRSIAVGELQMPRQKSPRPRLVRSSSGSGMDIAFTSAIGERDPDSPSGSGRISPSRSSIGGGSSESRRIASLSNPNADQHTQRWDAVVLSLGAEGLVKCFLWTQPRGSTSGTAFGVSEGGGLASVAWGFRWIQRSSWVISWADQAEDITCSQSTSLKDGDNMNPQTALMGSIKNSYFPLSVHASPDASLVLLTWKTKFVILKRKWLCPLDIRSDGQASNEVFSKMRSNTGTGSCRIAPAEFVRQAATTYGSKYLTSCSTSTNCGDVYWENGEFLEDGNVVLWTNTGHVFQFMTAESSVDPAGKFFIFTKDQDQLVPRSDSKPLRIIDKAMYVTSMDRCKCCDLLVHKSKSSQTKPRSFVSPLAGRRQHAGFTSCFKTGSPFVESILQVVHMCHRGSLGLWTMPAVRVPSPMRLLQNHGNIVAARVPPAERVRFHSLTDGFEAAAKAAQGSLNDDRPLPASQQRGCLTHFILGRDETQSSSTYELVRRAGMRRKRGRELNDSFGSPAGGASITSTASNVLATALAPVTGRGGAPGAGTEPETNESEQRKLELSSYRFLLDIPVIAKGFSDGMLCIGLLTQEHLPNKTGDEARDSETQLQCHSGRITAIAHSFWGVGPMSSTAHDAPSPSNLSQSSTEETYFATRKNPFHRSRFPSPNMKRSTGNRHLSLKIEDRNDRSSLKIETPGVAGPIDRLTPEGTCDTQTSIRFMVFTGGTDGVLRIIELVLLRTSSAVDTLVEQEARILQRFHNHRGPIQQISVSPLIRGVGVADFGSDWDAMYPDRLVATVGVDHRVVLYAPQYNHHPAARGSIVRGSSIKHTSNHSNVEWECVLELAGHGDRILNLDWHLERGLLYVESEDRMVYVWSTDTGILERTIPCALLTGGGNASGDKAADAPGCVGYSLVENSTLFIGNAAVQLIEFGVLRSAEQLKKNWSSYYSMLFHTDGATVVAADSDYETVQPSVYATGSMELFMLSLLLSWGITPAIDQSCRSILGIEPAHALYSCALQDFVSGALTIPVPWTTPIVSPLVEAFSQKELESSMSPAVPASARNWQHSSALSASIALGVVSFCMSLMEYKHPKSGNGSLSPTNKEEFQVLWSQVITQHSIVLPESVAHFREPALEELATFGFDSCEYIQLAARTLLSGVIKRLPPTERSALSAEYSAKLHWEMVRLETETGRSFLGTVGGVGTSGGVSSSSQPSTNAAANSGGTSANSGTDFGAMSFSLVVERLGSLVLLMSMIGTYFPGEISPAGAREVCDVLVFLLKAPERFVASVSAELLTKGLMLFRPHLVDLSSLMIQLLLIDMREKHRLAQSENGDDSAIGPGGSLANFNEGGTGGSNAAMSLLVEVGACESAFVLGLLQQEMHNHDRPPGFHETILLYMMELINTHYLLMCRHLPAFVDTIMTCLDPTKPERRRRCLPLSTRCLHSLVRRFPMVDFHKETQRLALGTMEAVIVIYDLRTATKWRVLDGHASAVSAVRFRSDGQVLVSYAARDGSVRWWNSGNAGLFGGMLKMHQSCLKEHKLAALKESVNGGAPASTGGASAGLKQIIQTCRFHFLTRKDDGSGGNLDQPKHILRLTREDASQVQFLL